MRILLLVMMLAASAVGCKRQQPWAEALSPEKSSLMEYHRPKLQLRTVQAHGKDSLLAEDIRKWAEGHQAALGTVARAAASHSADIIDRWQLLDAFDDGGGGLVISLFGAYRWPRLMAGCKVLMSFNAERKLGKVYVFEEPLE
jgi:hypothetical protein